MKAARSSRRRAARLPSITSWGTTARYTVTIPASALAGTQISEAALVDADGGLCAIRNMLPKGKDADVTFTFTFDDEF